MNSSMLRPQIYFSLKPSGSYLDPSVGWSHIVGEHKWCINRSSAALVTQWHTWVSIVRIVAWTLSFSGLDFSEICWRVIHSVIAKSGELTKSMGLHHFTSSPLQAALPHSRPPLHHPPTLCNNCSVWPTIAIAIVNIMVQHSILIPAALYLETKTN